MFKLNDNLDDKSLNFKEIYSFFKINKSTVRSENSSNFFLIGNKGKKFFIYEFNENEGQLTIKSFSHDILSKLSDGKMNLKGVKVEGELNMKYNSSFNRHNLIKILGDTNINFPPIIESYKYYFFFQSYKLIKDIKKIINENIWISNKIDVDHILSEINYIKNDIVKSGKNENYNIHSMFINIEKLNLEKERVKSILRFNKLFNKNTLLELIKFLNIKGEDYSELIKYLKLDNDYSFLNYYNDVEINEMIKKSISY